MNSGIRSSQNTPTLPFICAKCGADKALQLQDQLFRYRPLIGWLAIPFLITIEIVWKAKVYLCHRCSRKIRMTHGVAMIPPIVGILLAVIFGFLPFIYLDYGFALLLVALISFLSGVLMYALIYSSSDPKTIKVDRQSLILDLPNYGAFDYTRSGDANRIK